MNKKTVLCLLFTACSSLAALAQVKIGNNPGSINPNAVLELESTNKGLLLTRIALTSTTSAAPLTAHVAGMFVYNTATANDVSPGIYYNDGTKWQQAKFATCQGFGANFITGGTQNPPSGSGFTKVQFSTEEWDEGNVFNPGAATSNFTVKESGRYIITGTVFTSSTLTAQTNRAIAVFKNNTQLVQGSNTRIETGQGYGLTVSYIANLVAGDVIDLRLHVLGADNVIINGASFSAVKADCGAGGSTTTPPPTMTYLTVTNPTAPVSTFPVWNYRFQTEANDVLNEYDPATGRFTAASTGYYVITLANLGTCTNGPFGWNVHLAVNTAQYVGSNFYSPTTGTGAAPFTAFLSVAIQLNAGDVVYPLSHSDNSTGTCTLNTTASRSFMTIMRVR